MLFALVVFTARTGGRAVLRGALVAEASGRDDHDGAAGRGRRVHAAGGGRGGGAQFADLPAFCRVAATLKPSADSDIKIEVWLPAVRLERQVPGNRQRRLERQHRHQRAGHRHPPRLRDRQHRHRAPGRRRPVDAEPREADRLRPSRRPRDDREGQSHRRRVLRQPGRGSPTSPAARPADARRSSPRSATPKTSTASSPARRRSMPPAARCSRCTSRRTSTRTRPRTFPATKYPAIHDAVLQACDALTA